MTLANRHGPIRPAATHLIDMALRRAVLTASGNLADRQARMDCAELALALDLRDEARLLFETAMIPGGYDKEALAAQEQLRRETSLWEEMEVRYVLQEKPGTGLQARIDGALVDLAACLTLPRGTLQARIKEGSRPIDAQKLAQMAADFGACVHSLHQALRAPLGADILVNAINALVSHPLISEDVSAREHVAAPIKTLIALLAAETMRHFLQQRSVLFVGQLASPALIHRAAGFERVGLGPWFSRAASLVPDKRALIDLAGAARIDRSSLAQLQRGLALLSAGLDGDELATFVDVLGDEGLLDTLELVANRYRSVATPADRPVLWRLRDAAIDLGANELAIEMQSTLLSLSPFSSVEANILAELRSAAAMKGYSSTTGRQHARRAKLRAIAVAASERDDN